MSSANEIIHGMKIYSQSLWSRYSAAEVNHVVLWADSLSVESISYYDCRWTRKISPKDDNNYQTKNTAEHCKYLLPREY